MSVLGSELVEVPLDENNIPLPIIPSEDFPHDVHSDRLSKHHEYFLEGSKKVAGPGPIAVRGSRVLRVEKEVHNTGLKAFHRFYDRSPVPYNEQSQFEVSLLNAAGYVPSRGIDLWNGNPIERAIEKDELAILTAVSENETLRSKNLIYYTEDLRPFYNKFLQKRYLTTLPDDLIEDFMHAPRNRRRKELGHEVLNCLAQIATHPLVKKYKSAFEKGQLNPNMPPEPSELVVRLLGRDEQREKLFTPIRNKLASISLHSEVKVVELPV